MSRLGELYDAFYAKLAGRHPDFYPWHYQFLSGRAINGGVQAGLAHIPAGAKVLDVGCGTSPYRAWLPPGCSYTGLDIEGGRTAPDIVVNDGDIWPVAEGAFDAVLCNQVWEHAQDAPRLLAEIKRVLKPGGVLLLSVPFIYGEHGLPHDYRRFTAAGVHAVLAADYDVLMQEKLGRIGTVLAVLLLNWVQMNLGRYRALRFAQPFLLPFWLVMALAVNVMGWVLDALDRTGMVYQDSIFVGVKRA